MKYHFNLFFITLFGIFFLINGTYTIANILNYSAPKFFINSPEQNFPTTTSSFLEASHVNCNNIQLSWTNGNGKGRLIVARKEKPVNVFPKNGLSYKSNSVFGSGEELKDENFVVYIGSANNTTITVESENTYYFAIFEYNNFQDNFLYFTSFYPTLSIVIDSLIPVNTRTSDTIVCLNNTIKLDAGKGFYSYLWNDGSKNRFQVIENNGSPEKLIYSVTALNEKGCSINTSFKVSFELCHELKSTNTTKSFEIYPNPGNNFKLQSKNKGNITVKVYSLSGNLVFEKSYYNNTDSTYKNIDLRHLYEGIYLIQVDDKKQIQSQKISLKTE